MARRKKPAKIINQSIQVSVVVNKPRGTLITPQLLTEAVNVFLESGDMPTGFEISGILWTKQFPGRKKEYAYTNPSDFHEILQKAKQIGIAPKVFSLASER